MSQHKKKSSKRTAEKNRFFWISKPANCFKKILKQLAGLGTSKIPEGDYSLRVPPPPPPPPPPPAMPMLSNELVDSVSIDIAFGASHIYKILIDLVSYVRLEA